jgi:hypothetical protein
VGLFSQLEGWSREQYRNLSYARKHKQGAEKSIRGTGANKTPKAIERFSKAAWGAAEIIRNFDVALKIKKSASSHKHKSSEKNENIIQADPLQLKPFESIDGRFYEGFPSASSDTLAAPPMTG